MNFAAYSENSPIQYHDPTGTDFVDFGRGLGEGVLGAALVTGGLIAGAALLPAAIAPALAAGVAAYGSVALVAALADAIALTVDPCADKAKRDRLLGNLAGGALFGGATAGGLKALAVAGPKLGGEGFARFFGEGVGGQNLRLGLNRAGGDLVFRLGGEMIGAVKSDPHIVIHNYGPMPRGGRP